MGHSVARSARGVWRGFDGGDVSLGRWSMAATLGGLDGGLIWVYGVGWSWFVWVCLVWVVGWSGYVWRHGGMETMAFWSALIFLCVGSSVLVDLMLNLIFRVGWSVCVGWSVYRLIGMCGLIWFFFGFWWFFVWVDRYVWVDLIFLWFLIIFRVGWSVCVGWTVCGLIDMCGLIGFFFGFLWFFVWGDRYVWVDLIFLWFLMMVVMVAVGLWERGAVREWIIKMSKIMNILLNKCVE